MWCVFKTSCCVATAGPLTAEKLTTKLYCHLHLPCHMSLWERSAHTPTWQPALGLNCGLFPQRGVRSAQIMWPRQELVTFLTLYTACEEMQTVLWHRYCSVKYTGWCAHSHFLSFHFPCKTPSMCSCDLIQAMKDNHCSTNCFPELKLFFFFFLLHFWARPFLYSSAFHGSTCTGFVMQQQSLCIRAGFPSVQLFWLHWWVTANPLKCRQYCTAHLSPLCYTLTINL